MVDFIRKQLNELMGEDRNDDIDTSVVDFKAPQHCRYYLCGLCPFDLLQKTKYDIGICPYTHALPARNAYEEVKATTDYGYEALLERKLKSVLRECDKRIEANQRRVEENEREKVRSNPYDEEISELSAEYDKLMENGDLDEASQVQTKLDELKSKRSEARAATVEAPGDQVGNVIAQLGSHPQYQALRVCEQCGLLLSAKETTKLEDHYIGKLHTGFVEIREKLADLQKQETPREKATVGYETELPEPVRADRQRDRDRPRYGDARDREYERDRDRDRYRNKDRFQGRRDHRDYRDYDDRRGGYGGYRDRDGGYRDRDAYRDRDSHRDRDRY